MKTKQHNIALPAIILIIATTLCCCTHNNGDIGPIFGKWKLTQILLDQQPAPNYTSPTFWSFQNSTMGIIRLRDNNEYDEIYSNFQISDNTLTIDFEDQTYTPFPELLLPDRQTQLQITKLTSSEMQLYLPHNPKTNTATTYKFKKW